MASLELFPPIVENSADAVVVNQDGRNSGYKVYFSLSKFSSVSKSDIKLTQISIKKLSSGESVVNTNKFTTSSTPGKRRVLDTILFFGSNAMQEEGEDLYSITLIPEDVMRGESIGWEPGWIYQIQLRLATDVPTGIDATDQNECASWIIDNASSFSEWSTGCVFKATGQPIINIPPMKNYSSANSVTVDYTFNTPYFNFFGTYENELDSSEVLYSYEVELYDLTNGDLLETSGTLYTNTYIDSNKFYYEFKTELQDYGKYKIVFSYSTINRCRGYVSFDINIIYGSSNTLTFRPITIDNIHTVSDEEFVEQFNECTSIQAEEDDGRIGIKLYESNGEPAYSTNICIRRADSKDNFRTWTTIKVLQCINKRIKDLPMFFDNTIESGVWYKYNIMTISGNGVRSIPTAETPQIKRDFNYSILVGGGRQLRLMFNNTMNTYSYTRTDAKVDTLGSKFPFITRSGNVNYRQFPINALISFHADENELFASNYSLYKYDNIVQNYLDDAAKNNREFNNIKKEFDFREEVLKFLGDGEPKLFKSATEGNIVVRLMNVAAQPNSNLNRQIASITANAIEIAEATIENCDSLGIIEIGETTSDLSKKEKGIGQVVLDVNSPNANKDIMKVINSVYNHSTTGFNGSIISLEKVYGVTITFEGSTYQISNLTFQGNSVRIIKNKGKSNQENTDIKVTSISRKYVLDENVVLNPTTDTIQLMDTIANGQKVKMIVDFTYERAVTPDITTKAASGTTIIRNIGQIRKDCVANDNLYNIIASKYYYNSGSTTKTLTGLNSIVLESQPNSVFLLSDDVDYNNSVTTGERMVIGPTGSFIMESLGNIHTIKYLGVMNSDGSLNTTTLNNVIVSYTYTREDS